MLYQLLKNIRKKKDEDIYYVNEAAFYYEFNKASLDHLNNYHKTHGGLIADWYRSLTENEKAAVKRTPLYEMLK